MLITKLLAVAVFVLPATSLATPSKMERIRVPAVPPAPVALSTLKVNWAIKALVNAVVVIAHPVDDAALVISEIRKPLTASLKVTIIWLVTSGEDAGANEVLFPPERICEEVNVTVGRVASIFTFAKAVEAPVVVPPRV